jgi:hypothetical protein
MASIPEPHDLGSLPGSGASKVEVIRGRAPRLVLATPGSEFEFRSDFVGSNFGFELASETSDL